MSLHSVSRSTALALLLLVAFTLFGYHRFAPDLDDTAGDLASSFVACRLVSTHDALHHLYAHDPIDFAAVGPDDEWETAADDGQYTSWLHPYVQTPLWAWSLQPLCRPLPFATFGRVFLLLTLACFAGIVLLVAAFWAPALRSPLAIALTLLALWFSTPFQYAMTLLQTHVLYLLLTLAALLLAQRSRPIAAGTLLALAAAVKLTPAILLVYWLVTRRFRAALSFVLASVFLLLAAPLTTGLPLFREYLATLHRVSHILLVSLNNQSLAAAVMGHLYPAQEIARIHTLPLPPALSLLGSVLTLACAIAGGLLDRRHSPTTAAPLGALLTLVAATLFTPIAWTHYFIVLLPTLMVLADRALTARTLPRALAIALPALLILALNLPPLSSDPMQLRPGPLSIVRAQFFAGLLSLLTLAVIALADRRYAAATRPTVT